MTIEIAHFLLRNRTSIILVSFVMLRPEILTHRKSSFVRLFHFKFVHKTHYRSRRTFFFPASFDANRSTEDSSCKRMRLVPVFILETNNQTNNEVPSAQVCPDGS